MNFFKLSLKRKIYCIALLVIFNLLFHFIPFERRSIAPDNYSYLAELRRTKAGDIFYYFIRYTYRPLSHYVLDLQSKLAGDNPNIGLWLVFSSSLFVLFAIFFLFNELFNDNFLAFIASLIFCLLPNKLEMYHNTILFNINIVTGIYIWSLIFYICFIKQLKWRYFAASLVTYAISIFWYEVGFFLPLAMAVYSFLFQKKNTVKYVLYLAIPAIIYLVFRVTNLFGLGSMANCPHKAGLSGAAFIELIHHYFGRYIIRSILYGFYKFLSIEQPWLTIIIVLNIIFLIITSLLLRKKELRKIDNRLLVFAGVLFVTFYIPFFLYKQGSIGGRHLVLPSTSIVIFSMFLLEKTKQRWRFIFIFFLIFTMIICQGNAWAQVIASRINSAVYDTIKEKKEELSKADYIVIDTKSFADNIPFTMVQRDFNVLNTYYGAQAFEDRAFESMVELVVNNRRRIYIATESPKVISDGLIEFKISKAEGYRAISKQNIILPNKRTIVIGFKEVYGKNFNNGLRKK